MPLSISTTPLEEAHPVPCPVRSLPKPIAITLGDPAGIGPEIIAKAFRDSPDVLRGCFVVGDVASLRRAVQFITQEGQIALPVAQITSPQAAFDVPLRCLPVLQITEIDTFIPMGKISGLAGKIAGDCVLWAARAALRGDISAMVTAPLHKEALSAAGLPYAQYPGHTELLQAESAAFLGLPASEVPVRMMLANEELRTVLVSIHLSLREAIEAVTLDSVLQTLRITDRALRQSLHRAPRIAVAGLNPHAGEGGLFGVEEQTVIAPAIAQATAEGLDVHGPFAPDTVFMRARAKKGQPSEFDVVVAMYHDQGLIPVKYLGVEQGVNVTLGLPLVRTSPDHGTAFDIAGTGQADASSLLASVRMARQLLKA
jgi:4-hydroxythreonine-4-phosphate dehydrogenase